MQKIEGARLQRITTDELPLGKDSSPRSWSFGFRMLTCSSEGHWFSFCATNPEREFRDLRKFPGHVYTQEAISSIISLGFMYCDQRWTPFSARSCCPGYGKPGSTSYLYAVGVQSTDAKDYVPVMHSSVG